MIQAGASIDLGPFQTSLRQGLAEWCATRRVAMRLSHDDVARRIQFVCSGSFIKAIEAGCYRPRDIPPIILDPLQGLLGELPDALIPDTDPLAGAASHYAADASAPAASPGSVAAAASPVSPPVAVSIDGAPGSWRVALIVRGDDGVVRETLLQAADAAALGEQLVKHASLLTD